LHQKSGIPNLAAIASPFLTGISRAAGEQRVPTAKAAGATFAVVKSQALPDPSMKKRRFFMPQP